LLDITPIKLDITPIKKMYCCPSDTQEAFFASLKPRSIKATTIGGTIVRKRAQAPRSASWRALDPVEKACPLTFAAGRTIQRQSRGGLRRSRIARGADPETGIKIVALRSDLAPEQRAEALRIGRIGFASAGARRKPKQAIAA